MSVDLRPSLLDACHQTHPEFNEAIRYSHGYRVFGASRRVGTVESHRYDSDGSLEALIVRSGRLRRHLVEIQPSEVEWVLPRGRQLILHTTFFAAVGSTPRAPERR